MCRTLCRTSPGLQPESGGFLRLPCLGKMMRHQFRLALPLFRELVHQGTCDRCMELLATSPQQRPIRDVLDQGVLEQKACCRRHFPATHQTGFGEPIQSRLEPSFPPGDGTCRRVTVT